jgi:hypothetical protein
MWPSIHGTNKQTKPPCRPHIFVGRLDSTDLSWCDRLPHVNILIGVPTHITLRGRFFNNNNKNPFGRNCPSLYGCKSWLPRSKQEKLPVVQKVKTCKVDNIRYQVLMLTTRPHSFVFLKNDLNEIYKRLVWSLAWFPQLQVVL